MPQMTVLEILNRTKVFFEKKGVPDARLDAEYIISHGLGMKSRMDLYLNFEKPLTATELDTLRPLVARRANREPLQHIVGDTSFRGHIVKCDPRALIPRPETESLVDMAIERLKGVESPFIVEVGTGTAAISIACAKEIAGAKVLATDISEEALSLARENAEANELSSTASESSAPGEKRPGSLQFAQGDLLDAVTGDAVATAAGDAAAKIDCLIANLPYIPDGEKGKLQPEVDKYDPELALFGGPDGLTLVRKLLQQTEGKLSAGAPILLEIGSEQAEVLKNEAGNYPWLDFEGIHKDYCGNIRFVSYKAK
ncbi:peptide chain release factor N(5)-glutamine methyltransferase [Fibrobacter sp.]|uniref:peptide chain release factor N(5)-glutamine methyltransferase n=1 Tax=Fibrobacter sp. TaxID=35828 RepID=UPI001B0B9B6C|nr:peptide chain release factor N(5)-glutamine methyltransferase [Fibrobacter sp.]MBO7062355.1 peptide chain release factor N(5)-glutamine methyltransferase [Fibrobacter sp.]MBR3668764.1 peptide chain release factor N(5)-glutamine methyltransferase [Fibrobacter sp.]